MLHIMSPSLGNVVKRDTYLVAVVDTPEEETPVDGRRLVVDRKRGLAEERIGLAVFGGRETRSCQIFLL